MSSSTRHKLGSFSYQTFHVNDMVFFYVEDGLFYTIQYCTWTNVSCSIGLSYFRSYSMQNIGDYSNRVSKYCSKCNPDDNHEIIFGNHTLNKYTHLPNRHGCQSIVLFPLSKKASLNLVVTFHLVVSISCLPDSLFHFAINWPLI